eukprot:5383523-Pleurochrysis_carterae.AAC.5
MQNIRPTCALTNPSRSRCGWLSLLLDGCARPCISDAAARRRAPPSPAFVPRDCFDVSRCDIDRLICCHHYNFTN